MVEGLVTTAEVSEGGVDSLCVQGWEEGLSMDLHLGIWAVEHLGWVRRVFIVLYSFVVPFIKNKRFCYHLKNTNLGVLSITAEH